MQIFNLKVSPIYTMLTSAAGIGIIIFAYVAISIFAGVEAATWVKVIVGLTLITFLVAFVYSCLYLILDYGGKILGKANHKEQSELLITTEDTISQETSNVAMDVQHELEPPVSLFPIVDNPEEQLFTKRYVTDGFKDKHIFEIINEILETADGGKAFMKVIYCAKRKNWISMMPPYKDAELIFGDKVGGKSNYNEQKNNVAKLKDSEIADMRIFLQRKYDAMQKKYPSETSLMDEAL